MQLRDYQQRAIDAVYYYFEHNSGNPLVVVPTGGGKSVIIGALCRDIITSFPNQRIIVLSHVKELLEQNLGKIQAFWPGAPAGLYCAGLGERRARDQITVASIQSVCRKAHVMGWRDLIFIDEAHLLSPDSDSMYQRFVAEMKEINRRVKVVGFTATDYRLKTGRLTEGKHRLFTDVAIEISLAELLEAGHIAPLVSKSSAVQADLSGVRITGGEFNARDMERELDREALTRAALAEVFALAGDRRSWLVFCAGVAHAGHVRDAIRERGVSAETVTGDTPPDERDAILRRLKAGQIRAVTNANVLTTGFDAPGIDLIVLLRATTSPGLYVQMLGRGMRSHPGKKNCLVLDYAGNIERHGPVTHVKPPRATVARGHRVERNEKTCAICPKCRMASPLGAKECGECGYEFPEREAVKHGTEASTLEVMPVASAVRAAGEWLSVTGVRYIRHEKEGKIPSMRVEYACGLQKFSEWVCLAHPEGYALGKARDWWRRRYDQEAEPPTNIGTAIMMATGLKRPRRIRVTRDGQYWRITGYEFDEDRPAGAGEDTRRADDAA
jgi:DNA repair protein RadD